MDFWSSRYDQFFKLIYVPFRPLSLDHSLDRSIDRSIARSLDRSMARSLNRSVARSIAQSIARSLARSLDRSIPRSIARSLCRSIARTIACLVTQGSLAADYLIGWFCWRITDMLGNYLRGLMFDWNCSRIRIELFHCFADYLDNIQSYVDHTWS